MTDDKLATLNEIESKRKMSEVYKITVVLDSEITWLIDELRQAWDRLDDAESLMDWGNMSECCLTYTKKWNDQ